MAGHVVELDAATLGQLIDGSLPWDDVQHIQSSYKDPKRFDTYVNVLQSRVSWKEPIVLPLSPYLSIVKSDTGIYVVKCLCGQGVRCIQGKITALLNEIERRVAWCALNLNGISEFNGVRWASWQDISGDIHAQRTDVRCTFSPILWAM